MPCGAAGGIPREISETAITRRLIRPPAMSSSPLAPEDRASPASKATPLSVSVGSSSRRSESGSSMNSAKYKALEKPSGGILKPKDDSPERPDAVNKAPMSVREEAKSPKPSESPKEAPMELCPYVDRRSDGKSLSTPVMISESSSAKHSKRRPPVYQFFCCRFVEALIRRVMWQLGKAIPHKGFLCMLFPLAFITGSATFPFWYREHIAFSSPFASFFSTFHGEQRGWSARSQLGIPLVFNGSNPAFDAARRLSTADFGLLLHTKHNYDNVITDATLSLAKNLRARIQGIDVPHDATNLDWKDICREDCRNASAIVERLEDPSAILKFPDAVVEASKNLSKTFIGHMVGDVDLDSDGVIARARALSLRFKMKENLKGDILRSWEKSFDHAVEKEKARLESSGLSLYSWTAQRFLEDTVTMFRQVHIQLGVAVAPLLVICFFAGLRCDAYRSRPCLGFMIGLAIALASACGYGIQFSGVKHLNVAVFPSVFAITSIGILLLYSLSDSWGRYSKASIHPSEKMALIMSWDATATVIILIILAVTFVAAGLTTANQFLQYLFFVVASGVTALLIFSVFGITVSIYAAGKREAEGIRWYLCCAEGDTQYTDKQMPGYDKAATEVLHERIADVRGSAVRKLGALLGSAAIRSIVVMVTTVFFMVGVWGCVFHRVDLHEEHFVATNSSSQQFLAAYRTSFPHGDKYLEVIVDGVYDYYDRHRREALLDLLRWAQNEQFATRAVSWLIDFERFQQQSIYDINPDTIVPVINFVFLASEHNARYSTDLIFDKFQTQIIASRMYLELSPKGVDEKLVLIRGLRERASASNIPLIVRAPFLFSLLHDEQLLHSTLISATVVLCSSAGLAAILFANPALFVTLLVSQLFFAATCVGYSAHLRIPLNIVTLATMLLGNAHAIAIVCHFCYHFSNAGRTQNTGHLRVQYAFQCSFKATVMSCVIPLLVYIPILLVTSPLVWNVWWTMLVSSGVSLFLLLFVVPTVMLLCTEELADAVGALVDVCGDESPARCCFAIDENAASIYFVSNPNKAISYHSNTINVPVHRQGMLMAPPPPGYISSTIRSDGGPRMLPYRPQTTPNYRIREATDNSIDSFESSNRRRMDRMERETPRRERRHRPVDTVANDESIYEEPESPFHSMPRRMNEDSLRSQRRFRGLPREDHFDMNSRVTMESPRDGVMDMQPNWRQYLIDGSIAPIPSAAVPLRNPNLMTSPSRIPRRFPRTVEMVNVDSGGEGVASERLPPEDVEECRKVLRDLLDEVASDAKSERRNVDAKGRKVVPPRKKERGEAREAAVARHRAKIDGLRRLDSVDLEQRIYGKRFVLAVRSAVDELKHVASPKSEFELRFLGIDAAQVPERPPRGGGGRGFTPLADNGRGAVGFGRNRVERRDRGRKSETVVIERLKPSHKAEHAWKPSSKIGVVDPKTKKYREIRSLLNKITPSTYEALTKTFLDYEIYEDACVLPTVIDIIFDKAVEEPKFCPMYSDLCNLQTEVEQQKHESRRFRDGIIHKCQKTFESDKTEHEAKMKTLREEIDAQEDARKKAEMLENLGLSTKKFKRRILGNISFIGELYRHHLITPAIINWCVVHLLRMDQDTEGGDEESIECAVKMLSNVGKTWNQERLQQIRRRLVNHEGKCQLEARFPVDSYIAHLKTISANHSNRIRFMIVDLIELKKNCWNPRRLDTGPKTIKEVHMQARKEELENKIAREKFEARERRAHRGHIFDRMLPAHQLERRHSGFGLPRVPPIREGNLRRVNSHQGSLAKKAWFKGAEGGASSNC
ncbi:hypothetical protein QR680_012706 [Steinernema hermaphroditum]|uniref:MIF4G domain-containing protein n=1 Tax=Steinernema hermaphroditum TaxID=289476 RepID=A0AA39I2W6_9BILA|nr:hypothetical protein QR680_012706 [Steinernema hermaphroditum]